MQQLFSSTTDPTAIKSFIDVCHTSFQSCGIHGVDLTSLIRDGPKPAEPASPSAGDAPPH
eukprot:12407629-Karenia_brevis.AAC.1